MKYKLIIFDLDGTVLDTLDDLTDSVNAALEQNRLPGRTKTEVRSFVGNGIRLLIERSVPVGCDMSLVDAVFDAFRNHYKHNSCNKTKPYDGITALLTDLKCRDVKLAVVSNKADFAVRDIVDRYFNGMFDYYAGEKDGIPRKPAPDSVYNAMKFFGVSENEAIYVGDSEVDIETSKNAGLDCICVSWGFRDRSVLAENGAETVADDVSQLERLLIE